ncbi:hypothetical protein KC19_2G177100 [Ceratodon purpureus]|uniref:Uncharacterized protein n=1 Tax=Ceratodon purpureus TaxID=3225 RepID=A0A8T0IXY5_CERPU|nr:hypothetical protein KC19_2G177100 [Ceratodon purpureus]
MYVPDNRHEVVKADNIEGVARGSCANEIYCRSCQKNILNCFNNIKSYNSSNGHLSGHQRFVELSNKLRTLDWWNIGWAPTGRSFVNHHTLPTEGESQFVVFKAFRCKKFYEYEDYSFNMDKGIFRIIEGRLQLSKFAKFAYVDKNLYAKSERFVEDVAYCNYAPHDDPTDHRFGFILWLHPKLIKSNEVSSFWFNEYKICIIPSHASAFIFNVVDMVHCMTTEKKAKVLGFAFVQNRDFITV